MTMKKELIEKIEKRYDEMFNDKPKHQLHDVKDGLKKMTNEDLEYEITRLKI